MNNAPLLLPGQHLFMATVTCIVVLHGLPAIFHFMKQAMARQLKVLVYMR